MDLNSMKRKQLQELCKKHGIPANLTNLEMVDRLSSVLKVKESEKPAKRMRSCLKNGGEVLSEDRSLKKVRFSGENDVFKVSRSKGMGKVNHRLWCGDDGVGSVRVTTGSKRASFGGHEVLISSPVVMKKRGRRVVKDRELVVDLSNGGGEEGNEVVTGKLLRNRRVWSAVEGHVGKVVIRGTSGRSGDGGSDCEGGVAYRGVSRKERGLRRSTQNVKSFEESGDDEIVGKRNTRSRNQLAVDVSVVDHTNISAPEVGDKVVDVRTRRSLRKRGAENTSGKSIDKDFENKGPVSASGRNTRAGKALRRLGKNMEETEELNEVPELTNVDLVGKRNTRSGKGSAVSRETKTEMEFKNEDAQTVSRKILRQRSQSRRTNANRIGDVVEEKTSALDVGIPESEKALRWSKRNGTELVKLEPLQKELGKAETNGRRKTRCMSRPAENSVNTESGTTVALQEASEMPIKAEKSLLKTGRRVNKRHADLGNKVGEEIGTAVQSDESPIHQTRFSIRKKSIIPQIKKVRTEEYLTEHIKRNKTGEKDFSNKSKELNKDSITVGHVRRSRRNASVGDSLVIPDAANRTVNSIVMIKTRKRAHELLQEKTPLPHGRHVKTQHISFGDKAARETEVAVQFSAPVQQRHTRSCSTKSSVFPMAKKRRMNESVAGNSGPNKVVGVTELLSQSKKKLMEQKDSEIRGHVRRSGRNASENDSPATSNGTNDIDRAVEESKPSNQGKKEIKKKVVEIEYGPVSEEPSGHIILSASKSASDRTAKRSRGRPIINPVSSSKPPILEAEALFPDYGPVGEEPSGRIILSARKSTPDRSAQRTSGHPRKNPVSTSEPPTSEVEASFPEYDMGSSCLDAQFPVPENPQITIRPVSCTRDTVPDKIACSILQDSSNDVNSETPNFAEARDVVLANDLKVQNDKELEVNIPGIKHTSVLQEPSRRLTRSATKHDSVSQEISRRFTRSATKGKTGRLVFGKLSQKKPGKSSRLPLIEVEASLPEFTLIAEIPAVPGVQNLSEVSVCPDDQILSSSDTSKEKADFSPRDTSPKATSLAPNLDESKVHDVMNTLPSDTSKHDAVEKPATAYAQLSLTEVKRSNIDPVSSATHIDKENSGTGIQPYCFTEVNTETVTLVPLTLAENSNAVVSARPEDISTETDGFSLVDRIEPTGTDPPTSKHPQQTIVVVHHDVVTRGASTQEEQPINQLASPEVAGSTIAPVSVTSGTGDNTTCAMLGRSAEANAETPGLVHLQSAETLDYAGISSTHEEHPINQSASPEVAGSTIASVSVTTDIGDITTCAMLDRSTETNAETPGLVHLQSAENLDSAGVSSTHEEQPINQLASPEVAGSTIAPVSDTSGTGDNTTCAMQGRSAEANAETPGLVHLHSAETLDSAGISSTHEEYPINQSASPEVAGSTIAPVSVTTDIGDITTCAMLDRSTETDAETPGLVHLQSAENLDSAGVSSTHEEQPINQLALPEVAGSTIAPVSVISSIGDITTFAMLGRSAEANAETPGLVHLQSAENLDSAGISSTHEEHPINQSALPEVAGSTIAPVSVTSDIGDNTMCAILGMSVETDAEAPGLVHLQSAENVDTAGASGSTDTVSVADGFLSVGQVNLIEMEEKTQASKDVQPSPIMVDHESMASSSEQEIQEVTRANESIDHCSVQAISLHTPEKEIPSACFIQSEQENQLKPLIGTPHTTTSGNDEQISTGDVEHSVAEIPLEKIQVEAIHGRLSPGNPFEIEELKEMENSDGSVLRLKGEKLTKKTFNSIEPTDGYTDASFPEINGKELECTGAAKCQNNKQLSTPGSQSISEATFEAKLISSKKSLIQSASARGLLDDGVNCHITSNKVMKNLPFYASLGDMSPCTNELVGGIDESAFLAQVDIDCTEVKDAEPPKCDIAETDAGQGYERKDDASALATEDILINEDAMHGRATLLSSCATLTSTEEINEEYGSFGYGATEFFDLVMFSSDLSAFSRGDDAPEEETDAFSQKNNYVLENCVNTREGQESLTVSLTTEQLHKTEVGKLGGKDAGFLHNQIPGSVVPRCGDDMISVDINVATLDKTLGEFQRNGNVHLTSSTIQDESLTNTINKLFAGDECDAEASERGDISVSSESKL